MRRSFKFVLSIMLFLLINPSFADVRHINGYSYIVTGVISKLDTDEEYIEKFTDAFGGNLDSFTERRAVPRTSNLDGSVVAYILRDSGKARGKKKSARTTTSIAAYNQEIPQAVKDLAIAEFSATADDFKAFPMGFKFKISEHRGNKFTARFYLYRKDKKRDGSPDIVDIGEGTMLAMPKGVYKNKTKLKSEIKGIHYSLWGHGKVKDMTAELEQSLKDAGFETHTKSNDENGSITFKKGEIDGRIGLEQTTTKDPSVNLVMLVKSAKCKLNMGGIEVWAPKLISKCN